MPYRLIQLDDLEAARAIHGLAFPADHWAGDSNTFWVMEDHHAEIVGFCSAQYIQDRGVFLSRSAVVARCKGLGLQRRMIQARLRWAKRNGHELAYTYATHENYDSIVNLLRCGFRFAANPPWAKRTSGVHYFHKAI